MNSVKKPSLNRNSRLTSGICAQPHSRKGMREQSRDLKRKPGDTKTIVEKEVMTDGLMSDETADLRHVNARTALWRPCRGRCVRLMNRGQGTALKQRPSFLMASEGLSWRPRIYWSNARHALILPESNFPLTSFMTAKRPPPIKTIKRKSKTKTGTC